MNHPEVVLLTSTFSAEKMRHNNKYNNPTLKEMYVQIDFDKSSLTTEDVFKVASEVMKMGFTETQTVPVNQVTITPTGVAQELAIQQRFRFWKPDKTLLIQVMPQQLIMNQVGQYIGWTNFSKNLFEVVSKISNAGLKNSIKPSSLLLCAIDGFLAPEKDFKLGRFLNCEGKILPQYYKDTKHSLDISYGKGFLESDGYNRQLTLSARHIPPKFEVNFQTIFQNKFSSMSDMKSTLEDLHDESNDFFEDMITDFFRNEIMGGKVI